MDLIISRNRLRNMFNIESIIFSSNEEILLYDDDNDNNIVKTLLYDNYDNITKYDNNNNDETMIMFKNILHGDYNIAICDQLSMIIGKRIIKTNILSAMALCNFNQGTIVDIMDKYFIMPDTYTYLFVTLFHPYETMVCIGDRYFSSIDRVKEYNSSLIMRIHMIEYVQSNIDKLKYVLDHDKLIIKIFDKRDILKYSQYVLQSRKPVYTREYHYANNTKLLIDNIRTNILNKDFGEITNTLKDIKNIKPKTNLLKNKKFHTCIQKYIMTENRWDLVVSDSYPCEHILEYGSFDIIKSFSDMLDNLKNKFGYDKSFYRKESSSHSRTGRLIPTPYSIHLFSEKKAEMKLSLFEKDKYNTNTFSCIFPYEDPPILEPVKYYTDTNIYRILDILDKCISFNGIESNTKEIILTVSHPKNIFDKYISSIITGIIPLFDSSFEECVRYLMVMDEYPNRLVVMRHISPYIFDAFEKDITHGNYIIDSDTCTFLKELCNNYHELSEFYFLIRQYERLSVKKNENDN